MPDGLATLIARIDEAVQLHGEEVITQRIKRELQDAIRARTVVLPERFHRVRAESYARRLLHKNDDLGYTAVVMTWGPGQRTPLHDHAGIWCVEVVVKGEMDVTQYELEREDGGLCRFRRRDPVHAGIGSAGCLIPPFEHHVLANASPDPSMTLHVYGGEITRCNVYLPRPDGWYERQTRVLAYDD